MHKVVYLSLGSNVGDRAANLNAAIEKLEELGTVVAVSSFYETEPVETSPQPWFLNCAVGLETEKPPEQLMNALLEIERQMGRERIQKKGPRTIDILGRFVGVMMAPKYTRADCADGVGRDSQGVSDSGLTRRPLSCHASVLTYNG